MRSFAEPAISFETVTDEAVVTRLAAFAAKHHVVMALDRTRENDGSSFMRVRLNAPDVMWLDNAMELLVLASAAAEGKSASDVMSQLADRLKRSE